MCVLLGQTQILLHARGALWQSRCPSCHECSSWTCALNGFHAIRCKEGPRAQLSVFLITQGLSSVSATKVHSCEKGQDEAQDFVHLINANEKVRAGGFESQQ